VLPERPSVAPRRTAGDTLREFIRVYRWRAFALPVLVVVTIVALLTTDGGKPAPRLNPPQQLSPSPTASASTTTHSGTTTPPVASGDIRLKSDAPGAGATSPIKADALPPGAPYTMRGNGTFRVLQGTSAVVGSGTLYRYDIEVENGITGINLAQFASLVQRTLADKRSWTGHGVSLQRVDSGPVAFHVTLVSSMTVRTLCGYDIPVETSCYARAGSSAGLTVNRVVINDSRWVRGDAAYIGDLNAYRVYMINHEDGHALGHEHAHECLSNGLAPVMMQQTIGLVSAATGKMCAANPWPYPPGATDAPGAEQPDTPQNSEFDIKGD
jgi:hypothetical protein